MAGRIQSATTHESEKEKGKRKRPSANMRVETTDGNVPWYLLDERIIEEIVARIPVLDFFRYRLVCKQWNSFIKSPVCLSICHRLFRKPWFYMLRKEEEDESPPKSFVYDSEIQKWLHIDNLRLPVTVGAVFPVASAGGLLCYRSISENFIVGNVLIGAFRILPDIDLKARVIAVAMQTVNSTYKVFVVFEKRNESSSYCVSVYSPSQNCWTHQALTMKESINAGNDLDLQRNNMIERTRSRELSGVISISKAGHTIVHYLNSKAILIGCNTHDGTVFSYPPIIPVGIEYSVDLVVCRNRVLLVVLVEKNKGTPSITVCEYDEENSSWNVLSTMPSEMSKKYQGKKVDINCAGHDDLIMICVSSDRKDQVITCNLKKDSWIVLPRCTEPGSRRMMRFVAAHCFEPRVEATV